MDEDDDDDLKKYKINDLLATTTLIPLRLAVCECVCVFVFDSLFGSTQQNTQNKIKLNDARNTINKCGSMCAELRSICLMYLCCYVQHIQK